MKFNFIFFFVFIFSPSLVYSQKNRDEAAIFKVFREEERAWNAHDIEAYVALYAPLDSSRMILSKGVAAGKDNILAFYKKYWPEEKMGSLKLEEESLERISKKFYFITGYFHVTYPNGKSVHGRYSSLMVKLKGKWYIYTDHSA